MLSRRTVLKFLGASLASLAAGAAYAFGYGPLQRPRIARYRLAPDDWPKGTNLRIAALADIHACEPWMSVERIHSIVDQTNSLKPDLIVLLGDYVAGMKRWRLGEISSPEWAKPLGRLAAPLGVHAVLGNHDWWDDREAQRQGGGITIARRALEGVGIPVYENSVVRIDKDGKGFWLAGLADQLAILKRGAPPGRRVVGLDDLGATISLLKSDEPAILLAHEPDIFPSVPDRFCLTLCGHTHGGQVKILGWRPAAASIGSRIYPHGHFQRGKSHLIVSGGLGCSIAPVRVGVAPEIVLIELGPP
ncbi:MAG: metallophosphoesterase [Beijerinckiaceae bacterium]|nr:metallophosphoesterase [Beijerinckiaceae bacterium]MCZ8300837.1 metallophosphoesterase [Beijerinckiaceae bacterium]